MAQRRQPEATTAAMRVKLKYPNVDTFLVKYGPHISRGAVFISTKAPKTIGTTVRFDFVLVHDGEEKSVLRGEGIVKFIHAHDPAAPSKPYGMGLQVTMLHDDGEALVERAMRLRGGIDHEVPTELPHGVREITGEIDLVTGPVPRVDLEQVAPDLAPGTSVHDEALDELARSAGLSPAEISATLRRTRAGTTDDAALEALRAPTSAPELSTAEALRRLDALLARRE